MYNIPQEMIDEFNKEMKARSQHDDIEFAHESMDTLMCDTLENSVLAMAFGLLCRRINGTHKILFLGVFNGLFTSW